MRLDQVPEDASPVSVSQPGLIRLNAPARAIALDVLRVKSLQTGAYVSHFRGRGMEFDESRPYQPGDDPRSIDWRVTARSTTAYTKLFREERERPVLVVLDAGPTLYFGTRRRLKSVAAGQMAAAIAWAAVRRGDRIGGFFFAPGKHRELRPAGGRRGAMRLIQGLVDWLQPERHPTGEPEKLSSALERVRHTVRPGSLVIIVSDFFGLDAQCNRHLSRLRQHSDIIGSSDALLYVLHKIRQVAPTHATVLIQGETGVGKELVANAVHDASDRASGPFVVVNCAALPPSLIESELFGHEKGAFTGADRQRRGRFELAHRGTIFLDEVGEVPLEMQPKLLRVLQEGEIERVGGSQTIPVDVRVIAATNRELKADIEAGGFREDLFYRISVYPITVPPLRDRSEDIPALVQHFTRHFALRRGRDIAEIPAEVMRRLESYDWPGNVRELQNVIERAVLTSTGGVLKLAEPLQNAAIDRAADAAKDFGEGLLPLDEVERRYIERVLASSRGKISGTGGAAEVLGLHANTLRYRMKKLGIPVGRGKNAEPVDR